jgi:arylsulfatase A-like enzyme
MPFPRIKGQEYELSNHMPLAIMWKKGIKNPGRIVDGFVSFTDFAPTFLDIAGINSENSGMQPMEGESLSGILQNKSGSNGRNFMVIGKERHDVSRPDDKGYPIRGIIREGFLYLKNYAPERWPAGNPETGYMECDGSPTKTFILNDRRTRGKSQYWDLNFGLRQGEELYKISDDPFCMKNLAGNPEHAKLRETLDNMMTEELKKEGDPRIFGKGDIFDSYPYSENASRNFYNRFMAGEPVRAGWIQQSDIERK